MLLFYLHSDGAMLVLCTPTGLAEEYPPEIWAFWGCSGKAFSPIHPSLSALYKGFLFSQVLPLFFFLV